MSYFKILLSAFFNFFTDMEEIVVLSHRDLFNILQSCPQKNIQSRFSYLHTRILELTNHETVSKSSKIKISRFKSQFLSKWAAVHRIKEAFISKYVKWLDLTIKFQKNITRHKGRPKISFQDSSERTKRLKTGHLRSATSTQELAYATQMSFRAEGNVMASKILKDISNVPQKAEEYCTALNNNKKSHSKLTSDEALSLIIEAKLSKSQYNLIRNQVKEKNCDVFPAYDEVLESKRRCYPAQINIHSDTEAEITLQSLLNHTSERLIQVQESVVQGFDETDIDMSLVCKWGFDGSSGQSEYKQRFEGVNKLDSSVFLTSLVPIKLVCNKPRHFESIIWQNPRSSSPRFCRPLKLQFARETTELTMQEKTNMDNQIKNLVPFRYIVNNKTITVHFELHLTMIDGKVCNALTSNNSTQKCYICGATSRDFNNIEAVIQRSTDDNNFKYGLSTLHAWIRFFECLLHLAYKMSISKWQARGAEDKLNVLESKKRIQEQLRSQVGLIVDKPKPGFGSSNDGNTARRFFENADIVSEITKINIDLIKKFHVILQTLSSGFDIDVNKFKTYALETAKLFVSLYPWYVMPVTVHKVLLHGSDIINSYLIPIGQLSEEAQEARNKDIKKYREDFSRKTSRTDNLKDVINRLLVSSDPCISSLRKLPQKKIKTFHPEALELFKTPLVNDSNV